MSEFEFAESGKEQRMKLDKGLLVFAAIGALGLACISSSMAQGPQTPAPVVDPSVKVTLLLLGRGTVPGKLYEPIAKGDKSHIGVFVMHNSGDYLDFSACTELSKRGYT